MAYYQYGGGGSGGSSTFLDLTDVLETSLTGEGGNIVAVNGGETGLVFATASAPGAHASTHANDSTDPLSLYTLDNSSATQGTLPVAASGDDWEGLAPGTEGYYLTISSGVPAYTALPTIPADVTDLTSSGADGDLFYESSGAPANLTLGTTGYYLTAGASAPQWSALAMEITDLDSTGGATGDVYYRDGSGDIVALAAGSDTEVLTLASGVPTWAAAAGGGGGDLQDAYDADETVALVDGSPIVLNRASVGVDVDDKALIIASSSAATSGNPQYSPSLTLRGAQWVTSASQVSDIELHAGNVDSASAAAFLSVSRSLNNGSSTILADFGRANFEMRVLGNFNAYNGRVEAGANGMRLNASSDYLDGHNTADHITSGSTGDRSLVVLNNIKTDGASAVANAIVWDKSFASAPAGKILTIGYTTSSNVYTPCLDVRAGCIVFNNAQDADTPPTGYTGAIAYFSNGDGGSPCLAVYNGTNWLRIALGTAVASS